MAETCYNYVVLQGENHSSTKEYYTTHFSMIELQCKDCGEVLIKEFRDRGDEKKGVDAAIRQHRAPNITIEWLNEQDETKA